MGVEGSEEGLQGNFGSIRFPLPKDPQRVQVLWEEENQLLLKRAVDVVRNPDLEMTLGFYSRLLQWRRKQDDGVQL